MTNSMESKAVAKFGASEMMYVESMAKKLWNVYTLCRTSEVVILMHTRRTHLNHVASQPKFELYDYQHETKGQGRQKVQKSGVAIQERPSIMEKNCNTLDRGYNVV